MIFLYFHTFHLWPIFLSVDPWAKKKWRRSGLRLPQSWHQRSGGHFRAGDGLWENPEGKSGSMDWLKGTF